MAKAWADPESLARGGPTLITLGQDWPASETPYKWRFTGVLMMAQH